MGTRLRVKKESAQPPHADDQALTVPALIREGLLSHSTTCRSDQADEARAKQQRRGGFGDGGIQIVVRIDER